MSNALAVLNGDIELTPTQQMIMAEMESEDNSYDYIPTRIKFPTGGMMTFATADGDFIKPPVQAIIAVAQKTRGFWPNKETLGLPPLCSSADSVHGIFDDSEAADAQIKMALGLTVRHPALAALSDAKGPWPCYSCPLSQWQDVGNGKRKQLCKEMRRLVIIVEGWTMPAILTIPPTSIKVFDTFASIRRNQRGQSYFSCWAKLELEKTKNAQGTEYAMLKLSVAKPLEDNEVAAVMDIRKQYAEWVRSMNITAEDYDTEVAPSDGRVVDETTGEILDNEGPPF